MNSIVELLQHPSIAKKLVDSLPSGLLIVDDKGFVQTTNNFLSHNLGISKKKISGKLIEEALSCLNTPENSGECGTMEYCTDCEVRNLGLAAINKNQVQRARTFLQFVTKKHVEDIDFLISAVPVAFKNHRFSILVIEDIPELPKVTLPAIQKGFRGIVGQHPKMKALFRMIRQVARTSAPVLIQGKTGTGKELVAQAIHEDSPRAGKYFVPINCCALPEGLLETELFGHVKGAFTGAIRDKKGRFELADGGTLFLDEVGELSPQIQAKLLRVLEDGKVVPVGGEKTFRVDVRIISATNKELEKEAASGNFRKDLYYRLSAIPIILPPLRERRSDIPILAEHFLANYSREFFGKKAELSSKARLILMNYNWPGNVRELQNAIQFALARCQGRMIESSHLPKKFRHVDTRQFTVKNRRPKMQTKDVFTALRKVDGNKNKAAKLLGVSRSTLYRFLAKLEGNNTV